MHLIEGGSLYIPKNKNKTCLLVTIFYCNPPSLASITADIGRTRVLQPRMYVTFVTNPGRLVTMQGWFYHVNGAHMKRI